MQPQNSEGEGEPKSVPVQAAPAAGSPAETPRGAAAPPKAARARSRRRGKKKPAGAPAQTVHAEPLMPAYTETAGPRAPVAVELSPGAPTGEASELEMPAEAPQPPAAPLPATPAQAPAKRPSKGAVILSVGLPGSGKTTWFKRKGVTPLSSDLVRTLLFDDPTEQRHQDLVFSSLRNLLRARMMARMAMNFVDATNLSPKERRHWIRMAREFGYEAQAVFFDVPLETCMDRNRKRQRVVPEDVMQRMSAKLRPPTFEEGFSKIIVVRVKQRPADEKAAAEHQPEIEQTGEAEPGLEPDIE